MTDYIDIQNLLYVINRDVKIFSKNITVHCYLAEAKNLSPLVEKNICGFTYAVKLDKLNHFIDIMQDSIMNSDLPNDKKDNICYALQKYKIS